MSAKEYCSAHHGLVTYGDMELGFGRDGAFEVGYLADSDNSSADRRQGAWMA